MKVTELLPLSRPNLRTIIQLLQKHLSRIIGIAKDAACRKRIEEGETPCHILRERLVLMKKRYHLKNLTEVMWDSNKERT